MQVSELFALTEWVQEHISKAGIIKRYNSVISPLQQNMQSGQQAQPFSEQKDVLLRALRSVPVDQLTNQQKDVLRQIGILSHVGEAGAAFVEDVLYKNAVDTANAHTQISAAQSEVNRGIKWAQDAIGVLREISAREDDYELEEGEVIIRARFADRAAIENVTDLKKWGKTWWDIARGITMLAKMPPESVRVVGASSGSIIISLATVYGIAKIVALVEREILSFVERVIGIQIKIEELKALRLSNDAIVEGLKQEIETSREEKVTQITGIVIAELQLGKGADGEATTNFKNAVKALLEFQEKGGQLDFVVPANGDETDSGDSESDPAEARQRDLGREQTQELQTIVSALRVIEERIKAIGYDPKSD